MNRLSKHDVNKLSIAKLREKLPFEVVADGEMVFVAYGVNKLPSVPLALPHDVNRVKNKPKARHDVNKLTELPLSKKKQAQSTW